jgi:hypothetical protein
VRAGARVEVEAVGGCSCRALVGLGWRAEQKLIKAERQEQGALPVGEEAEVADAHEAAW